MLLFLMQRKLFDVRTLRLWEMLSLFLCLSKGGGSWDQSSGFEPLSSIFVCSPVSSIGFRDPELGGGLEEVDARSEKVASQRNGRAERRAGPRRPRAKQGPGPLGKP